MTRARVEGLAGLVVGLGLVIAYAMLARDLAVGPAEFAYAPFVPDSLPWGPMRGFTWEQLWDHVYRLVVLGPAAVLLSVAAYRLVPLEWAAKVGKIAPQSLAIGASAIGIAAMAFVMLVVLRGRGITEDELAYSMQAGFFLDGRLIAKDVGYYPSGAMTILSGASYTAKYLFGEALVQSPGVLVDRPALMHLPIAALGLAAFYAAVRAEAGATIAAWSTAFAAISPMFVLTGATGMSECTALACVMGAGLGVVWARAGRPRAGALLVAACLGFCAMARPQSAFPAAAVLGPAAAWALLRRKDTVALALLAGVAVAALAVIGAYDHAITGSALKLPWSCQCNLERYGFGQVWPWGTYRHTPLDALENLLVVAVRFNGWWLGWPLGLAIVAVWWILGRPSRGLGLWAGVGLAVVVFEAGYYSTGVSDTGAIYHFELLLPASVLAANTAVAARDRWPRAAAATLLAHLAIGTGSFFVVHTLRLDRLVTAIHADADAALARIEGPAVLLYETRNSESRRMGWIITDFPRQYRSERDRIVTYSRPVRERLPKLLAAFPGRSCWYYHRDPLTERAELLTCDEAKAYLDRPFMDDLRYRDIWVRPTAYKRAGYDPYGDLQKTKIHPMPRPCCALEELRRAGATIENPTCDPSPWSP